MPVFSNAAYSAVITSLFQRMERLAKVKGSEYSGDTDRLLNFRRNAETLGLNKETVWAVYAAKHWDALMTYIKDMEAGIVRERSEPISGRIDDLVVYLVLLLCMEAERENMTKGD